MVLEVFLHELDQFATRFWNLFPNNKVIAFYGEMGAGKTTIITALCKHKGVQDAISSPTFSIINEYQFLANGQQKKIFHIDLYRLNSLEEIVQAGVEDCVYSGEICFIEWPQKAPELLDDTVINIFVEAVDATTRRVKLQTSVSTPSSI